MPAKSVAGLNALVPGSGRGTGKDIARALGKEGANFFLPGPRSPREGVIRQLHHTCDGREVRAEHAPPGLHTVLSSRPTGPATHTVDDLVHLLWRRPGLVGGVDVHRDRMRWVPHGHLGGDSAQLFGLAVEQGVVAMLGLPPVVALLEGLQVHLGQDVMVANTEAAYAGDPVLLHLLFSGIRLKRDSENTIIVTQNIRNAHHWRLQLQEPEPIAAHS